MRQQLRERVNELSTLRQEHATEVEDWQAAQQDRASEKQALQAQVQQAADQDATLKQTLAQAQEGQGEEIQRLSGQLAAARQQLRERVRELSSLKQDFVRQSSELNESRANESMLNANLQSQEEESRKQQEAHQKALADLQESIQGENLEKERLQKRLQQELERSKQEYQNQLDLLGEKKQKELEKKDQELQKFRSIAETYQNLAQDLEKEIEQQTVTLDQFKEKLTVTLVNKIVFSTGSAKINANGLKILTRVAEVLKDHLEGRVIRVEGHTDSQIIGPDLQKIYPSNWHLSVIRAVNVVRYLEDVVKIPPEKLYAVGFGPYHPVADNETEAGRALNRRIEIVLTPEFERSMHEE
ncbi:hypothetical protein CSA57_01455 [candidate division KSB3 bacterium]|nr:MAG: hypothetical protein CSA57_01455 [candidate division KSB3 bacterium]